MVYCAFPRKLQACINVLVLVRACPFKTTVKYQTLHKRGLIGDKVPAVWRSQSDKPRNAFLLLLFFEELREQSCIVCIRMATAKGPRICVGLLGKRFGFCFLFLLRGKLAAWSDKQPTPHHVSPLQPAAKLLIAIAPISPDGDWGWARTRDGLPDFVENSSLGKSTCVCVQTGGRGRARQPHRYTQQVQQQARSPACTTYLRINQKYGCHLVARAHQ